MPNAPLQRKDYPDEHICTKTLADLQLESILRSHYRDEDFVRWGTARRLDIQCYYNGFPDETVKWIFDNKHQQIDNSRERHLRFVHDSATVEELRIHIDKWQQNYRKDNLDGLRMMEKYKNVSDQEIIQMLIDDLPSEQQSIQHFITHEKKLFQQHVKYIKSEQPDTIIPLSSRYLNYLDEEIKPLVTVCKKLCVFCDPSSDKKYKKK